MQVVVLFRTFLEGDVRQLFDLVVGNRHVEAIADVANAIHVHLLHLVRDVFTFRGVAHTIAFNGMCQNQRRLTFGLLRFLQCRVDFLRIVAAAVQGEDLFV